MELIRLVSQLSLTLPFECFSPVRSRFLSICIHTEIQLIIKSLKKEQFIEIVTIFCGVLVSILFKNVEFSSFQAFEVDNQADIFLWNIFCDAMISHESFSYQNIQLSIMFGVRFYSRTFIFVLWLNIDVHCIYDWLKKLLARENIWLIFHGNSKYQHVHLFDVPPSGSHTFWFLNDVNRIPVRHWNAHNKPNIHLTYSDSLYELEHNRCVVQLMIRPTN